MGTLIYGNGKEFDLEDRTLAHVKVAVTHKLRLRETFMLNFRALGDDREVSLWCSPEIPLQFVFAGSREAQLNDGWIKAMLRTAQRPRGLDVMPEGDAEAVMAAIGGAAAAAR